MMPTPETLDLRYPIRRLALAGLGGQAITWREAGDAARPTLVLLHGIGSGALAFSEQFAAFADRFRVLAWDAPGYGESATLPNAHPLAVDYAAALAEWLTALGVTECAVLGHSLGALMAGAFVAKAAPAAHIQVRQLILASPALGYGEHSESVRISKVKERVELITGLGAVGMAAARAAKLCTPAADESTIARVRWSMARCTVAGYSQAAHLLANDSLHRYMAAAQCPVDVFCGELDTVTTALASREFAGRIAARFTLLPGAAHACYVEHATAFNAALTAALANPRSTGTAAE